MKKIMVIMFAFCLFATNSHSMIFESKYYIFNHTNSERFNKQYDFILNNNKTLSYNAGKFNETTELSKTLTEILEKHKIYSDEFLFLLLGIAAVETYNGKYLNNPVARGLFQIEPETAKWALKSVKENDDWNDMLSSVFWEDSTLIKQLKYNLEFQVVLLYIALQCKGVNIDKLKLDNHMLATVWKKYWNTKQGKGTVKQFKKRWYELGIDNLKKEKLNACKANK